MSHPLALSPDTLLSHESFVRTVIRGVLRDESDVQDALQETWISALAHGDRIETNARGWLRTTARHAALAVHRSRGRRRHREEASAKPEATESVADAHDRLEIHGHVVQAVLGLKDPYRTAVVQRYFQGRDTKSMAAELGVAESTIRSQLSRAHDQLRTELDSKHERSQWAAIALPGALAAKGTVAAKGGLSAAVLLVAGGALAASGLVAVLLLNRDAGPDASSELELAGVTTAMAPTIAPTEETPALVTPPAAPREPARVGTAQDRAAPTTAGAASPDSQSATKLYHRATWIQRAIEKKLLTPAPELVEKHAGFLSDPGATDKDRGIARILNQRGEIQGVSHALSLRGNGAYYSFALLDHSYNSSPDLSFSQGAFSAGFNGGQSAGLLSLGICGLTGVPNQVDDVPAGLDPDEQKAWRIQWTDVSAMDEKERQTFNSSLHRLDQRAVSPRMGETFLLRMVEQRHHDHLVAFQLLQTDSYGCTILWRKLREWPVEQSGSPYRDPVSDVPAAPEDIAAELSKLTVEQLLQELKTLRQSAMAKLFSIPEDLREAYLQRSMAGGNVFARQGFTRLYRRGTIGAAIGLREGGAYFAFTTESQAYGNDSDLELTGQGKFMSGFAGGDEGWLLDLGRLKDTQLRSALAGANPFSPGKLAERWDFVRSAETVVEDRRRRLSDEDKLRQDELKIPDRTRALPGHSYLLRTLLYDDRDVSVVFTVIELDKRMCSIAWRVL